MSVEHETCEATKHLELRNTFQECYTTLQVDPRSIHNVPKNQTSMTTV